MVCENEVSPVNETLLRTKHDCMLKKKNSTVCCVGAGKYRFYSSSSTEENVPKVFNQQTFY